MKVELWEITKPIPYARNPRRNDEAVAKVASSIKEFGWRQPIVVDTDGVIIAGHTRLLAAQKLGLSQVPVHVATDLSPQQIKAYRLADNRVAEEAEWDNDLLVLELSELDEEGFSLDLTGFDESELAELLAEEIENGLTDEDAVPEVPETPVTVEGDVWLLGRHRVVCGDATNPHHWDALNIEVGVVVFSSPPYNLGDSIKLSGNSALNKKDSAYETYKDSASESEYIKLIEGAMACGMAHCDVIAFNLQPLAGSKRPLMRLIADHSSNLIDIITWDKGHAAPQIAKGVMASRYEWIFLLSNKDHASRSIPYASWQGKWSNVYQAPPQRNNEFAKIHGATFPVHLPEFVIGDLMNRSRGVVDCFCGTGTTIMAAEKLGKIGYGIEIDPKYCDVIIKRWQEYTGKNAVHEETGKTFNEMASKP